ncbi:MAG TPA: ABC transporter permease subunit [Verrucomicrobiae bacterium]|jgi:ABC-type transport system involved in multi-copper enzyme maturation permease subunit|nr:ABC transporter permease subunit [Verrucomicrobiae bacterium]
MNFLPIATRELQVTARRRGTYYWRAFAALNAACLTLAFVFTGFSGALSTASAGMTAFHCLSCTGYIFAAYAGSLLTADCISEERREGTLGLLLLTDLKGFDIVFGKFSRLANPLFCLAAGFPTVGFALILGGVSVGDFFKVGLALLNTLFFFAALGLLVSARTNSGRNAVAAAIAAVLIFSTPGVIVLAGGTVPIGYLAATPAGQLLAAMGPAFSPVPPSIFWWSFFAAHAMAWIFFAAASYSVTHAALEQGRSRGQIRRHLMPASSEGLETEPVLALVVRSMSIPSNPRWFILSLAAFAVLILVAASQLSPASWFDLPTLAVIVVGSHLGLKFSAANNACRCLPGRRHSGELELLLTTPLDQDAVVRGSAIALKRQLLWPVLFVLAMDLVLLALGWWKVGFWNGFLWALAMFVEVGWFLANLYSLTWLGLCLGLKSKSHHEALGRTLFCILFMPWSGLVVAAVAFGIATMGVNFTPSMVLVMAAEFVVLVFICSLGFTGWAGGELRDRFRILAAQQQAPPPPSPPPLKLLARAFEKFLNGLRG